MQRNYAQLLIGIFSVLLSTYCFATPPIVAEYFGIWTETNQTWAQKFRPDTPFTNLNRLYICFGKIVQTTDGHFTIGIDGQESRVLAIIARMQKTNPKAEIFLTVGGDNNPKSYGGAANDPAFAENVKNFLLQYHMSGIDIDWEQSLDKTNLSNLLQALGTNLHANNLKLTLDVWPFFDSNYDASVINNYVDQLNIMSYGTGLTVQSCAQDFERAGIRSDLLIGGIETEADYNQFGGTVDTLGDNGTIAAKANYALNNNLAGMMGWRMDNDYVQSSKPLYPTYQGMEALWTYMQSPSRKNQA